MEQLRKKPSKLLLVSSSGGHLKHLTATFDAWQNYERVWVSFKQPDVESALAEEKVYWAYYPTTRNVKNAIRNLFLAPQSQQTILRDLAQILKWGTLTGIDGISVFGGKGKHTLTFGIAVERLNRHIRHSRLLARLCV